MRTSSIISFRLHLILDTEAGVIDAGDIRLDHLLDELIEGGGAGVPAERVLGLCGGADEEVDLGGAEVALVHADEGAAGGDLDANLVDSLALETNLHIGNLERLIDEVPHGVGLTGGDDEVLGLVLLEHPPHAIDVVARVAPVALGVHVAEVEALLLATFDVRHREGDLTGHEGLTAAGGLVVEQDAVAREHVVRLAVVHHGPVRHHLGHRVRRAGVEWGVLILGDSLDLTVELRGGRLVEAAALLLTGEADRLEEVEGTDAVDFRGVYGHLERHLHVGLRGEIVALGGVDVADDGDERVEVGEVTIVEVEVLVVGVSFFHDVLEAGVVVGRGAALDAVDDVALGEEELDEVGAVLAGGTGDEGDLALAVASHGVHLTGLVLGRLAEGLDGGADGDGHCFV